MMKNVGLLLEYDGSRYDGWQKQGNTDNTIQGRLEAVLERMTGTFQEVHGSGRTDAGVHALGQVANVHLNTEMTESEIADYLNRYLPEDIRVRKAAIMPERFHSRLWAREKTYTYRIDMAEKTSVFERKYRYALGQTLDVEAMRQAAAILCGTHDFGNFCTGKNKKKSTVRTLKEIRIRAHETCLELVMTGDGFLYNMVRILAGTLIQVGIGERLPEEIPEILAQKDRAWAGPTAPAHGLTMMGIEFEEEIRVES